MRDPSHTQLEILRQESERGDWTAARRAFVVMESVECANCADLELALAVWAQDPEEVAAAIAKLEGAEPKPQPAGAA